MAATMNLSKLKLNDLKKELKDRGLTISGNKSELVSRLKQYMEEHETPDVDDLLADKGTSDTSGEPDLVLGGADDIGEEETVDDEILKDDEALPLSLDTEEPSDHVLDDKLDVDETLGISLTTSQEELTPTKEVTKITMITLEDNKVSSPDDKEHTEGHVKSLKGTMTASERLMIRAKKFGVVSDDSKLKKREERFGESDSTTVSSSTDVAGVSTSLKAGDIGKLKKRAERFGSSVAPTMSKLEETEKLLKRQDRFGTTADTAFTKKVQRLEDNERIQKRAERFGEMTSANVPKASSTEMDEKRRKRAARFGAVTSSNISGDTDDRKRKRSERFGLANA